MIAARPTWEPIRLACKSCGNAWDDWTPQDVPAKTMIAHWKTYHCPWCGRGGRSVLLRGLNAEPET